MINSLRQKALLLILSLVLGASLSTTLASDFRDSLLRALPAATSPIDSMHIYYDLLDTAPIKERPQYVNSIYDLAVRTHNITAQLQMLRNLANLTQNVKEDQDSLLTSYRELAEALPSNDMQQATLAFIDMVRVTNKSRLLSDTARREFFFNEIASYPGDDKSDLNGQILHHYTICLMLGGSLRSPMLVSSVDHLGELIRQLPYQMEAVRNIFYTQAARMYTIIGDSKRAVATDREMLRGIHAMQERYRKEGRYHRDYGTSIYSIYRRMLMNYRALPPGESDSIYNTLSEMAQHNSDIETDLHNGRVKAFYLLSKGKNKEAIPYLVELSKSHSFQYYHHIILRELVDAAIAVNDRETMLYAMPLYIESLEKSLGREHLSEAMDNELAYRMAESQRANNELGQELSDRRERVHKGVVIGASLLTIVLLVLMFLLYRLYVRTKRLSRTLIQTNEALTAERDKMKRSQRDLIVARDRANKASALKTDFINNMSREVSTPLAAIVEYSQFIVDNMDAGRRKYMQTFADVVTLSAELLQTLINDVLDTSQIEKAQMEINRRPESLSGICNMVIGNFQHRMKPGVTLEFVNPYPTDAIITTDPQRVEQVLMNLVSNASKFTDEGKVTLSYEFDFDRSHVTFSVTDTGIGIPEGKEHLIFERFEKLDSHTQGSGLGLYICSLICRLLGGTIEVDTTYRDGARFLFTIPA